MFRLSERLSSSSVARSEARRYLRRALLFGTGLLLLWIALQLVPSGTPPADTQLYSDDAGTVARHARDADSPARPSFITAGNIAAIIVLGGGILLALHLRRRRQSGRGSAPIRTLATHDVGPGQSIQLIECGGETHLVGVTSGQISLLKTYAADHFEATRTDDTAGCPGGVPPAGHHFADVLHAYAGTATGKTNGAAY